MCIHIILFIKLSTKINFSITTFTIIFTISKPETYNYSNTYT